MRGSLTLSNKTIKLWQTVQQQQANAFEALAATTQQQKYDAMFAAVPRYDGTHKEEYAVWLN